MAVEVILPRVDMAMESGAIVAWKVSEGQEVREGDLLFEIETDKATMEVEAPSAGVVGGIRVAAGVEVPVGTVVAYIYGKDETAHPPAPEPAAVEESRPAVRDEPPTSPVPPAPPASRAADRPRATPLARRLARERGIDLGAVRGSGERGRIHRADVEGHLGERAAQPGGDSEIVPFDSTRKLIARRVRHSVETSPHFFMTASIDMGGALALRRRVDFRPSLTAVVIRALGPLLLEHPTLNASVEGDAARLHRRSHIGVAMDRDGDLLVPVLRDAHDRSLESVTAELARLREAAMERRITPEEMSGGTFTLSNLGMYGIDGFTAIINPPESAILALGRVAETPVGVDGEVVLRPMARFTLSADHRLVDGVAAARFMGDLREALECPEGLL